MRKSKLRSTSFILFLLIGLFLFSGKSLALERTFYPSRDTYIKPGGSESHGSESTLLAEYVETSSITYRSYVFIIFDLKSITQEFIIDKATLSLNLVENHTDNCSVQIQRQGEPWNEYENYFSLGYGNTGTIYDIAYIVDSGIYNWDITQLISEWQSGKFDNYGVVMFATDECKKLFASRDHDNQSLRPKLTISYHLPPTSTPTPLPTATPSPSPTITPSPKPTPTEPIKTTPSLTNTISPTVTPTIMPVPRKADRTTGKTILVIIFSIFCLGGIAFLAFWIWERKIKKNKEISKIEEIKEEELNPEETPSNKT